MIPDPLIIDVTDQSFETDVLAASDERPVAVDFWAGWCAPCRVLGPVLEDAVRRHGGVTLAKLDVDANPATANLFGIRGIPAVKGFRDGKLVAEFVGLQPKPQVERFLSQLAVPAPPAPPPADETGLRARLAAEPDNLAVRRALGQLLIAAGRFDEADEVLAEAPADPVSDGLRAEIELLREGDLLATPANGNGDRTAAVRELITSIRSAGEPQRSRLRRVAVGMIESEREHDPRVESLRAELASALF